VFETLEIDSAAEYDGLVAEGTCIRKHRGELPRDGQVPEAGAHVAYLAQDV
jgi:hypothetical protein